MERISRIEKIKTQKYFRQLQLLYLIISLADRNSPTCPAGAGGMAFSGDFNNTITLRNQLNPRHPRT
jgi:hypothetical protein